MSEQIKSLVEIAARRQFTHQYPADEPSTLDLLHDLAKALSGFEFLAGIYEGEELTVEKVGAELHDFHFMLNEVPKVYDHVTGGLLSKPNYYASQVISAADDHFTRLVEDEIKDRSDTDNDGLQCIACDKHFAEGDAYYADVSGGFLHAECCGPERESYVGEDGEPLKPGEPIPEPSIWVADD